MIRKKNKVLVGCTVTIYADYYLTALEVRGKRIVRVVKRVLLSLEWCRVEKGSCCRGGRREACLAAFPLPSLLRRERRGETGAERKTVVDFPSSTAITGTFLDVTSFWLCQSNVLYVGKIPEYRWRVVVWVVTRVICIAWGGKTVFHVWWGFTFTDHNLVRCLHLM